MVGQGKSGISSGKLKDAKEHFYPLLGDASPEGVNKRRQLWSDLQKEYPEAIISLFFSGVQGAPSV